MAHLYDRLALPRAPAGGELSVVMAPAGVGKTSFLVQLALAELAAGRDVVHIALGQSLEDVRLRYETLFADRAEASALPDSDAVRADLFSRRVIQALRPRSLTPGWLETHLETFHKHLDLHPSVVLIDGLDWTEGRGRDLLASLKGLAGGRQASLWASAPAGEDPEPFDLALALEPDGPRVQVRLLKTFGAPPPEQPVLQLAPTTLREIQAQAAPGARDAGGFTLLSGGASGSEAEFGANAERHGVVERHFSFAGRTPARTTGIVLLTDDELSAGDVSRAYLESRMKRKYRSTEDFRRVLQSIWHQVNPAGEVFAVGVLQPDGTMKGGTGWAVELAKQMHKTVHVYDQQQRGWFTWHQSRWQAVQPPVIDSRIFAGAGTRSLSDEGRRAIRELFERSFGPSPAVE